MAKDHVTNVLGEKIKHDLLVIGGSAGSLTVVLKLIALLKPSMEIAVIVVFHRKQSDDTLIDVLSTKTKFKVKEADDKDDIVPGTIYIAPPDYHLLIEKDHIITLDDSEKVNYSRPSIDVTFESASEVYGSSLMCMLLSGANADGVAGLIKARERGTRIIVQDPSWAEVRYMPQEAVDRVPVDILMTPENMAIVFQDL